MGGRPSRQTPADKRLSANKGKPAPKPSKGGAKKPMPTDANCKPGAPCC